MDYKVIRLGDYIKDIASGPFGSNLKVDCFVPDGFPIIDGANLMGTRVTDNITKFVTEEKARSLSRSIAKKHDVVVTISGTLGQVAYIPLNSKYQEYLCSQRQFRVTFDESKIDVEYLVYYLHTKQGQKKILSFANYVGVPALAQPLPNFKNIEINLPPLDYQHKIASIIGGINDKISLNCRINAELEAMAKQIYNYWFVQFDFPDENGHPYKSSGGKMVYNEKLKREIPEGWEVKNINQLTESFRGVTYNKEDLVSESEDSILVLRGNNIPRSGQFAYDSNVAYIPREMVSVEQRINKGDIIITMSSGSKEHIGKCFMFQYDSKHTFGAFLSKFVPHEGCRYFVYLSMLSDYFKAFVKTTCNGTGINNLTIDTFNNVFFAVPSSAVLSEFENLTESIYNKVGLSHKIINDLTHLRDSLLPMLMNGQVTVE